MPLTCESSSRVFNLNKSFHVSDEHTLTPNGMETHRSKAVFSDEKVVIVNDVQSARLMKIAY